MQILILFDFRKSQDNVANSQQSRHLLSLVVQMSCDSRYLYMYDLQNHVKFKNEKIVTLRMQAVLTVSNA